METKEAIEFIREMLKGYYAPRLYAPRYKQLIKLLQRGEKFEKMWEEINNYPLVTIKNVKELINELQQKYFPKEVK